MVGSLQEVQKPGTLCAPARDMYELQAPSCPWQAITVSLVMYLCPASVKA